MSNKLKPTQPKNLKKIANLLFELGMLKRQKHTGVMLAGVENPDSTADHTTRTAIIAYILAELEGANPERTATLSLIHDIPETRIGDHHKVAARYLETQEAEKKIFCDQMKDLPPVLARKLLELYQEEVQRKTKEAIVAKDADWLEIALTVQEYMNIGYPKRLQIWIENVKKALQTESAKKLLAVIEKSDLTDWWQGLKKLKIKN